jgi:cytochrome c oxidase cbb3-type subunit 3
MSPRALTLILLAALSLAACERERRSFGTPPGEQDTLSEVPVSPLAPGGTPAPVPALGARYDHNAYDIAQGKRLFSWFNCTGCHSNGGGGMGPALMDDSWTYGSEMPQIAATIRDGRPNGMPAFGRMVPQEQIWQLAAYVRSMGRNVPKGAAPGRNDDMQSGESENRRPEVEPNSSVPPSGTR